MKRSDAFPHLVKTFDMPQDKPANDGIQYYYDRMRECVSPDSTPEQVIDFMSRVEGFEQAAKQLRNDMKLAVMDWIEEHGDLVLDQDTRYYVGNAKTTHCHDLGKVGIELIDACGGDLGRVFEFIKSEGWKHGAVKKMLGENKFNELYFVEEKPDLKTGKPKKLLKKTSPLPKPKLERKPK